MRDCKTLRMHGISYSEGRKGVMPDQMSVKVLAPLMKSCSTIPDDESYHAHSPKSVSSNSDFITSVLQMSCLT